MGSATAWARLSAVVTMALVPTSGCSPSVPSGRDANEARRVREHLTNAQLFASLEAVKDLPGLL